VINLNVRLGQKFKINLLVTGLFYLLFKTPHAIFPKYYGKVIS
jgi:hypothetical protein